MPKTTTTSLSPKAIDPALLGVCHWMGYRHQLYRHHPLTEGALVGGLAGLLSAHLDPSLAVDLEQSYSTLPRGMTQGERADVVIGPRSSLTKVGGRTNVEPIAAIEVKRSQYNDWSKDLTQLSRVWNADAGWTAWVLLLDRAVPIDEAADKGWADKDRRYIRRRQTSRDGISYVVRRVTHVCSAHARTVHRAVLLELV